MTPLPRARRSLVDWHASPELTRLPNHTCPQCGCHTHSHIRRVFTREERTDLAIAGRYIWADVFILPPHTDPKTIRPVQPIIFAGDKPEKIRDFIRREHPIIFGRVRKKGYTWMDAKRATEYFLLSSDERLKPRLDGVKVSKQIDQENRDFLGFNETGIDWRNITDPHNWE